MIKKNISIIAAIDENLGIGKNNKLLCHLPNDLKRFKKITLYHKIIMGRKTFDSLPGKQPLKNRINIILTRNKSFLYENCIIANTKEEVLNYCQNDETFIIGGAEVYKSFFPFANKLYLTKIHHTFKTDTFFPKIDFKKWEQTFIKTFPQDDKHLYSYTFLEFNRISD